MARIPKMDDAGLAPNGQNEQAELGVETETEKEPATEATTQAETDANAHGAGIKPKQPRSHNRIFQPVHAGRTARFLALFNVQLWETVGESRSGRRKCKAITWRRS